LVAVLIAAVLLGTGKKASAGEVLREPAASTGLFPWTGSIAAPNAPTSVPLPTTSVPPPGAPKATGAVLTAVRGDRAGLYGGTLELTVCDKNKLINFLEQNPSQGAAWASVQGIPSSQIRSYIGALTPVILAADTRVTNHGFVNGRPTPHQSVLQAGTAVLIDSLGVPRARCYCGNPLLPPQLTRSAPVYTGQSWPGFDPGRVVAVQPAPAPITNLTVINTNTGSPINITVGGPTTTTTAPPATVPGQPPATTATTLPVVTVPGQGPPPPGPPPPGSLPPETSPPPTTAPPPPTTAPPSTSWQLVSVRYSDQLNNNPSYHATRTPTGTGGQIALTTRGGGGLCDNLSEDVHFTWTFSRDVTTLNNGEAVNVSLQGATDKLDPTCNGGLAGKAFIDLRGSDQFQGFDTSGGQTHDGQRITGASGSDAFAYPADRCCVTSPLGVASSASDPAHPETNFVLSIEGYGIEFWVIYTYRQG
jgi:hypothetical protein